MKQVDNNASFIAVGLTNLLLYLNVRMLEAPGLIRLIKKDLRLGIWEIVVLK